MSTEKIASLVDSSVALMQQQRFSEALVCLDDAIAITRDFFLLFANKGVVLAELGRHGEAIDCFDHVLMLRPDLESVVQMRLGSVVAALDGFERKLSVNPDHIHARYQLGVLLHKLGRLEDALACQDEVLQRAPFHAEALNQRGNILMGLNQVNAAQACYERILHHDPGIAVAWFNRANALQMNGAIVEALDGYQKALELAPDMAEAQVEQAHCHLRLGQWEQAWPLYERRWQTEQLKHHQCITAAPQWVGTTDLAQHTILLWCEQGLGDAIQFVRYCVVVARLAHRVVLRVPDALYMLFHLSLLESGAVLNLVLITHQSALPSHDVHSPLMSLPFACGVALGPAFDCTVSETMPYLHAALASSVRAQAMLGPKLRPRIGVVWAGSQFPVKPHRDLPLELLHSLLAMNYEFVSLQKEVSLEDAERLQGLPIRSLPLEWMGDFAATAAVIDQLDLVISVDTAVAHLAGALGKPVWIVLRHSGEWRWMQDRMDSPWYPSVRLFRQPEHGDWMSLIQSVMAPLLDALPLVSELAGALFGVV